MADTVSSSSYMQFVATFADGDTRNLNINNPKQNVTQTEISELEQAAANVLIGDKYGAPFYNFGKVELVTEQTTAIEIL